jgi:hypothetical protein
MTIAVCFKCGSMKWGAFNPCEKCGASPQNDDGLALSLALNDHYFDKDRLEQIGGNICKGKPVHLDPGTRANMLKMMQSLPPGMRNVVTNGDASNQLTSSAETSKKKPWWRFW